MRSNWKEVPRGDIPTNAAGTYVSMNPKGLIAMSRATHQQLGEPKAFVILYDLANNRIGLKAAHQSARNAYPVRKHSRNGSKKISANRLIREFKIDLPFTVQFHDADTDDGGIMILDLRTAIPSTRAKGYANRKKMEWLIDKVPKDS